jgi:hypothetical protein
LEVTASLDVSDPDTVVLKAKRDRGDLDGPMSFSFMAQQQSWDETMSTAGSRWWA